MRTYGTGNEAAVDRDRVTVDVSTYVVGSGETLVAYGLGACVGVALYDADAGVGGLAHAMLPERRGAADGPDGKFVDTAVDAMLREMVSAGASYGGVEARVAGGATIFELEDIAADAGQRNVAAARAKLESLGVPVVGEAVGGDHGRSLEFDTGTGRIAVSTAHSEEVTEL